MTQSLVTETKYLIQFQIASTSVLNTVIFKEYAKEGILRKFTSLFPGLGYAAGYKVSKESPSVTELNMLMLSDLATNL